MIELARKEKIFISLSMKSQEIIVYGQISQVLVFHLLMLVLVVLTFVALPIMVPCALSVTINHCALNISYQDSLWKELLEVFVNIKDRVKKNDSSPINNLYDSSNHPQNQKYDSGGYYFSQQMEILSKYS